MTEQKTEYLGDTSDMLPDIELDDIETKSLSKHQPDAVVQVAPQTQTDRFVEMALKSGNMDQLEKMLALKERYDNEEARKQFTAALAAFKSEGIEITKDKKAKFDHKEGGGKTEYSYATLGNIVEQAVPIMSKHGLSHRWNPWVADGYVHVECILTHQAGHSEKVELFCSPDTSGKKNGIQQMSSAIAYLERYTFLAITGLATRDMLDDDGRSAGVVQEEARADVQKITEPEALALHAKLTENDVDVSKFIEWCDSKILIAKIENVNDIPAECHAEVLRRVDHILAMKKKAADANP